MQLERIDIGNFVCFQEAALTLPASGIVRIAGANNSGKTALLSALDVVAGAGREGLSRQLGSTTDARIRATFRLDQGERANYFSGPDASMSLQSHAFARVQIQFIDAGAFHVEQVLASESAGDFVVIATANGNETSWMSNTEYASYPGSWSMQNASRSGNPWQLDGLPEPYVGHMAQALQKWRARYFHFRSIRPGTQRAMNVAVTPTLAPTGENLLNVLLRLHNNDRPAWQEFNTILASILPDAGELGAPLDGSTVQASFTQPEFQGSLNLKDLGTGVEQLLMVIYVGLTQPPGSIVVIEEPEASLHPGAQRQLLARLRGWSNDRLFILATHSPVFLDQQTDNASVLLVTRKNAISSVTEADMELPTVLEALGVRLSDILSSDKVLVVEGESDREILRVWIPELFQRSDVAVVVSPTGSGAAWQMGWLDELLQQTDRVGQRRVVFLRDADELPTDARERLTEQGLVRTLPRREIENYLLDPAALVAQLAARNGTPATVLGVETILSETAVAMIPLVVAKRVVVGLPKIYFAPAKAVSELGISASVETLWEVFAGNLPDSDALKKRLRTDWKATEAELRGEWSDHWRELAPGEELLTHLWTQHGLSYSKLVDGSAIAARIAPSDDIAALVSDLLEN
jgi:predicted ATPase